MDQKEAYNSLLDISFFKATTLNKLDKAWALIGDPAPYNSHLYWLVWAVVD